MNGPFYLDKEFPRHQLAEQKKKTPLAHVGAKGLQILVPSPNVAYDFLWEVTSGHGT
jgi:hypothetical protein